MSSPREEKPTLYGTAVMTFWLGYWVYITRVCVRDDGMYSIWAWIGRVFVLALTIGWGLELHLYFERRKNARKKAHASSTNQ